MSLFKKNSLVIRLALMVLIAGTAVGVFTALYFHQILYNKQLEQSYTKLEQLNDTVSATASIASYLEDEELIKEVINGLSLNDIVIGASLESKNTTLVTEKFVNNQHTLSFILYSPFEKTRQVGRLLITPNTAHIEKKASGISQDNLKALTAEAFLIALVVTVVSYIMVTRPIRSIAESLHIIRPGGTQRLELHKYHQASELGILVSDINQLLNKTEQHLKNERELREQVVLQKKHFRMLFENSTAPTVLMKTNGELVLYNEAFTQLLSKMNVIFENNFGPYLKKLFADPEQIESEVCDAFTIDESAVGEFLLSTNNLDQEIWVKAIITLTITNSKEVYYQVTLHDISKRRLQIDALDKKANFDQLTLLLNRHAAEIEIAQLIKQKVPFALLLMDLNGFKPINDLHGHDAGDEILKFVAKQLASTVRKQDICSRWGGDEFVLALPEINKTNLITLADKLLESISQKYHLENQSIEVSVSASMGVAYYPDDKIEKTELIKSADEAMYQAKARKNEDPSAYLQFYGG